MKSVPLIHHRSGVVRLLGKLGGAALQRCVGLTSRSTAPVYLANSFPKSGTHLLDQIVAALPGAMNYGRFLASMTGSYQFRERSQSATLARLNACVPGEVLRAHLFSDIEYQEALDRKKCAHFFIYRDLRDVAMSEAFYLRDMNRWHRMHRFFVGLSDEAAIAQAICGVDDTSVDYPNLAERFRRYSGWLSNSRTCAVRYEDLIGSKQEATLTSMLSYLETIYPDHQTTVQELVSAIAPEKSHTLRKSGKRGWQSAYNEELKRQFKEVAGDTLIALGYESSGDW